jgi:hypothetical protein
MADIEKYLDKEASSLIYNSKYCESQMIIQLYNIHKLHKISMCIGTASIDFNIQKCYNVSIKRYFFTFLYEE